MIPEILVLLLLKNYMIFSMKKLICYISVAFIFAAFIACSKTDKIIDTVSNTSPDNRSNCLQTDSVIDSSKIYDIRMPVEGDSLIERNYMFYSLPITSDPDSTGMRKVFYCRSEGSESNVSYRKRFYKGTKYEALNPEVAKVFYDAGYGDKDAELIIAALVNDAFKQLALFYPYTVTAFDPYTDSVIVLRMTSENDLAVPRFISISECTGKNALAVILTDAFIRQYSNDECHLDIIRGDSLYSGMFHRMYRQRYNEIQEEVKRYKSEMEEKEKNDGLIFKDLESILP